jgi:hypothetical protein
MAKTPDIVIFVLREKLSDNSEVFNVKVGGEKFPAVTEADAEDLAEKISEAINDHTTSTAGVVYES